MKKFVGTNIIPTSRCMSWYYCNECRSNFLTSWITDEDASGDFIARWRIPYCCPYCGGMELKKAGEEWPLNATYSTL